MPTWMIWLAVVVVIALLTWGGKHCWAKAQTANEQFIRETGLNASSITKTRHLLPLSERGIRLYSIVLSCKLQSLTLCFLAAFATLMAVLHLPFGMWDIVLAGILVLAMVITSAITIECSLRQRNILYASGRIDRHGGIRPPITLTEER